MPVLGSGHPQADIFMVKHSALPSEVEEGVAFYGRGGNALMKSLKRLSIDPLAVYGTLCVKCPVIDPELADPGCVGRLLEELAIVAPKLVVVMGEDVRISTVAIAQGNLTISVQETSQVSQPQAFSSGQTTVVPNSQVGFKEQKGRHLVLLKEGASLSSLVKGLNALGVTPRDMISILQAIKASGALQADIQVM